MYYILLLSKISKLQFCSGSNYVAIFQLNSLPGKILFLSFRLGFFFENWENWRIFWIGNGAYIRPLVIGRKGPESPPLDPPMLPMNILQALLNKSEELPYSGDKNI